MRIGLFEQLFLRMLALVAAVVLLLVFFTHVVQQRNLDATRSADLEQEAQWIAMHWGGGAPAADLARAWGRTHRAVRMSVLDASGATLADSMPGAAPFGRGEAQDAFLLSGRAPIALARSDGGNSGLLVLSRYRTPVFAPSLGGELLLWLICIIAIGALALHGLARRLTATFGRLAGGARRVAAGHFGATLAPSGQRELDDLIASFNEMSLRLRGEEVRRGRLLADVSHELRSPLGRLRALAETILRRPSEAAPHLLQLEAEIKLMDRLVGDMLEAARFEQGAAQLARSRVRIADWAAQAFARLRPRIEQAGIACAIDVAADAAEVSIDAERMIQVAGNLVDNAIAATQGRTGARIELALTVAPALWELRVSDNGGGIPEEDLPYVFDRFFRVERHRGRTTGGAGLGLSICKAIVEAHGGTIALASTADRGTEVRIVLPRDNGAA